MKKMRHFKIFCVVLVILALGMVTPAGAQTSSKRPIRVGVIFASTGFLAVQGISQINAVKQLFEEKGLQVAGRKIKLIFEDSGGKPDSGLMKTKKLVELDKVDFIVGYISSAVGYAIRDFVHGAKMPTLSTSAGARHSRDRFSPYFFRVTPSTFQYTYEASKWWYQHGYKGKTYKKVVWMGADFAASRESFIGFKKGFEGVGGKVIQDSWPALGTNDFGPYLSALKVDEADALVLAMWGSMPIRLVNQWVEYGLKKRLPIIGVASVTDEGTTLPGMGVNADGILSWYVSSPQTDIPENRKFVEGYRSRYKKFPGQYAYLSYISAQAAYEALLKVKGNIEDKEKFLEALRTVDYTTPMGGRARFDAKQGMVYDIIMLEARKTNGEAHIFEIGRIKDVKDPYDVFP